MTPPRTTTSIRIVMLSHLILCCPCSCKAGKGSPDEYYFNPLKCPLPRAPNMEMFCLYGVGIPTERSYYYLNLESEEVMLLAVLETNFASYHVVIIGSSLQYHRGLLAASP